MLFIEVDTVASGWPPLCTSKAKLSLDYAGGASFITVLLPAKGNIGLYVQTQKKRLIRDGEVGGVENFISNTYSLHYHHQNDSALRWAVV